jgi:hypothetical protein
MNLLESTQCRHRQLKLQLTVSLLRLDVRKTHIGVTCGFRHTSN